MQIFQRFNRGMALVGLALLSGAALADGSGTLDDATLELSYSGAGPYFPANVTADTGMTVCQAGTPLCDVYTLTLDFSDALRNDPANDRGLVNIGVECAGAADDFDFTVLDAAGTVVMEAANAGCPEAASLPLSAMPNGVYTVQVIPYTAVPGAGGTFEAYFNVSGLGKSGKSSAAAVSDKSSTSFGGGLTFSLLLPFAVVALRRPYRR